MTIRTDYFDIDRVITDVEILLASRLAVEGAVTSVAAATEFASTMRSFGTIIG